MSASSTSYRPGRRTPRVDDSPSVDRTDQISKQNLATTSGLHATGDNVPPADDSGAIKQRLAFDAVHAFKDLDLNKRVTRNEMVAMAQKKYSAALVSRPERVELLKDQLQMDSASYVEYLTGLHAVARNTGVQKTMAAVKKIQGDVIAFSQWNPAYDEEFLY